MFWEIHCSNTTIYSKDKMQQYNNLFQWHYATICSKDVTQQYNRCYRKYFIQTRPLFQVDNATQNYSRCSINCSDIPQRWWNDTSYNSQNCNSRLPRHLNSFRLSFFHRERAGGDVYEKTETEKYPRHLTLPAERLPTWLEMSRTA